MAFCMNCGKQLPDGAKFCLDCGTKIGAAAAHQEGQRKTVYDGELHKCPNCSSLLHAFATQCDMCGYELRGSKASSVVRDFADEIKRLEQEGGKGSSSRIATHISTFPIPNTREELMEFLILSSTNISEDRYKEDTSKAKKAISDAWTAKFEQAYQKALLVFAGAPELSQIKEIYSLKVKQIKKNKVHGILGGSNLWIVLFTIGLFASIIIMIVVFSGVDARETERLDGIVDEVYEAMEDQDYDLARAKASSIVWNGLEDDAKSEKWDDVREDLLNAIDKAEQTSSD